MSAPSTNKLPSIVTFAENVASPPAAKSFTLTPPVEFADNNFKGLDAQMALAYNNLGFVHFKMDNPEKAERAYIQALQIWEEIYLNRFNIIGSGLMTFFRRCFSYNFGP